MSFFCINLIVYMGYVLIYLKRMYLCKAINSIYIYLHNSVLEVKHFATLSVICNDKITDF